jgi:hypothetical protein
VRGLSTVAVMACPVCKFALSRTSFFQHSQHNKLLDMEGAVRKVVLAEYDSYPLTRDQRALLAFSSLLTIPSSSSSCALPLVMVMVAMVATAHSLMKTGDLFSTLKDYNRFLEEVETIGTHLTGTDPSYCHKEGECVVSYQITALSSVYKIPNEVDIKETMKQYTRYKRKSQARLEITEDEMRRRRDIYLNDEAQKFERTQREGMLESLVRVHHVCVCVCIKRERDDDDDELTSW